VFAQHRLKPYTSGQDAFAARDHLAVPEEVVVDGQKEAHVERILARRVRSVRGKEVEEWKVRWTGYSKAHDQWRTRDKLERGSPLQQLREFEQARLHMEAQVRDEATRRREQRGRHSAQAGMTLAHLITNPCDELDQLEQMEDDIPLPWERQERVEDGSLALVTELLAIQAKTTRTPRILVLFSGTGSVEREFLNCFPSASVVTLDSGHIWQPTHVCDILQWDYKQYPPGFFDVIWASPPCRQYSQARTTGGPPDLPQADKIVRRALQIIDYLEPKYWFMENPRGRFPNALRLRPMMRQLPPPLVCTYCMYGTQYMKPTCIWTNSAPPSPLLRCTTSTPCACRWATGAHPETAQLGPHPQQTGAGRSASVYPVPALLLRQLFRHLRLRDTEDPL
jgi:hypothetical protein